MAKTLKEYIYEINELVKVGSLLIARSRLKSIQFRKASPSERLKLAEFSRRLGDPLTTIRLLNPVVRAPKASQLRPTPSEKAIYAAALIKIGAASEALQILEGLDPKSAPERLLYQAHALFTHWKYKEAIPLLHDYVQIEQDRYQKIIGKINLAAALVQECRHQESAPLLNELFEETKELGLKSLQGNTLEILAQQEIQCGRWFEAEEYLEIAGRLLQSAGGLDEFFVRKWKGILHLLKDPKSASAIKDLKLFQQEAVKKQHWETVRECDRFLAISQKEETVLLQVYFGTPFASYRAKLLAEFPKKVVFPDHYIRKMGKPPSSTQVLRFLCGEEPLKGSRLKVGQLKHRVLRTLVSDFYRPFRVASLFGTLYPGEYYDPVSSPARIHQAIKECKEWLRSCQFPLAIREGRGGYRLYAITDCAVEIPAHDWWEQNALPRINELRKAAMDSYFSATQASQWLGVPRRSVFHLLEKGIASNLIERVGLGRSTRYRFLLQSPRQTLKIR